MVDDIDVLTACTVLDIETELKVFAAALRQRDPSEHAELWGRAAKRLWSKVFQISPQWTDVPATMPVPSDLARELAMTRDSPRRAASYLVASALVAVSGCADAREAEAARLARNLELFLETPAGRERKAYLDRPGDAPAG